MIERSRGTGPRATVKRGVLGSVERSRGTGPRATVKRAVLDSIERSRGTGPRATVREAAPNTVGRGPVPRRARDDREIARDRPSRYGNRGVLGSVERSRGTGPRATVKRAVLDSIARSRGTGPRATVIGAFWIPYALRKNQFFFTKNLDKNAKIH